MSSWYDTGYDGMKREQERLESQSGPQRLWIPSESSKEIIFVDDDPFCIHEHNPKLNGSWKHWLTCLQNVHNDVPCCELLAPDYNRYYVGYYTVVDCSKWTDKKGNSYQYEVKLLPAKLKTLKKLKRKKEDRGTLVGCMYRAVRDDSSDPVVGNEFEFMKEVDLDKVFEAANYKGKMLSELWSKADSGGEALEQLKRRFQVGTLPDGSLRRTVVPFNYMQILKPMSPADVRMMLKATKIDSRDDDSSGGTRRADEDVPF